jgi:hypothetical protein
VLAALEAFRGDQWTRNREARITCAGRTSMVRIEQVSAETGVGRARNVRIEGQVVEDRNRNSLLDVSYNGYSPEELTELAVKVAVLGEENPLYSQTSLVCWYLRFGLSYRDLEELLAERGVEADHVTLVPVSATFRAGVGRRGQSMTACGR